MFHETPHPPSPEASRHLHPSADRLPVVVSPEVLRDIAGKPMLARVLGRLARATRIDAIALATSVGADDDHCPACAAALGLETMRGAA